MSDIKIGLWQNVEDDSFIRVNRIGRIGAYYSDKWCGDNNVMSISELKGLYVFVDESELAPVVDDTPATWININDGSCINVVHIGNRYAYWGEDGSSNRHSMDVGYFTKNYRPKRLDEKPVPVVDETINSALEARKVEVGSKWTLLNEYNTAISKDILAAGEVEVYKLRNDGFVVTVTVIYGEGETSEFELYLFVNLFKCKPVVDDTFNDDTPAQTFGGIQWDMGTQDKIETILVTVCSKCGSTVPADSVEKPALSIWAARFLKAVKGIEVGK